ncbi:hypothetical protein D3C83_93810 [compost metagenome]
MKEAVDKMYGKIRVESTEGVGTSFFVTIPVIEIETATMLEQATQLQKAPENNSIVEVV